MKTLAILTAALIGASTTIAFAQDGPSAQEKARQGMMRIMALNMGMLGGMAKGEIDFDAANAQAAADTLVAVSGINQGLLWPKGSDNDMSMHSNALPAIWEKPDGFSAAWTNFGKAAMGLQAAVAGGQAALGPAMGAAGKACGGCHETYRVKQN